MSKKIITFLGTGNYEETTYSYTIKESNENISIKTRFVQEAIHEIVGDGAVFYVALTDLARKTNWVDRTAKIKNFNTYEEKEVFFKGLKPILDKKGIEYKEISLMDGKDEHEIWENFESIFESLEDGDEVYVDVTHSFRSLPIIVMSVLNYAKFIKNITIKAIFYGAYEARVNGITPIFDLSLFTTITDWTVGAERFINTGDSKQLSNMINMTIRPILKETEGKDKDASVSREINKNLEAFSGGLHTARGNMISEYGTKLKSSLELIKEININELKPFEKILEKIYDKVHFYSNDIVMDVHNTVKLCLDLNLIQQAYTFLRENIVNYLCTMAGAEVLDSNKRELIEKALYSCHERYKDKIKLSDEGLLLKEQLKDYVSHDLAEFFDDLGKYRNDLNHAGYRKGAKKFGNFEKNLKKFIDKFEAMIISND